MSMIGLGRPFGDGDEPLPLPGFGGVLVSPHRSQTVVRFLDHCRGPALYMFILKTRGTPRRVPRLRVQYVCKLGECGGVNDECVQVGVDPVPVRGRTQSLPEDLESVRAVAVAIGYVQVRMVAPEVVKGTVDDVVPA